MTFMTLGNQQILIYSFIKRVAGYAKVESPAALRDAMR